MKNVFKKTVAFVSAMSLMAVATAVSASTTEVEVVVNGSASGSAVKSVDASGSTYTVNCDFNSDGTVGAGNTISATLVFHDSTSFKYDTLSLKTSYDSALTYAGCDEDNEDNVKPASQSPFVMYMYNRDTAKAIKSEQEIVTYTFNIPSTAKKGDKFTVTVVDPKTEAYEFHIIDSSASKTDHPYSVGSATFVIDGAAPVTTTTPAPTTTTVITTTTPTPTTTTVTTTTTPTPTTTTVTTTTTITSTSPVETSTSPVETSTSTSPVETSTTTSTSPAKQDNSPATGSSSNGVAALAVTMVAAAGTALALKKKKD